MSPPSPWPAPDRVPRDGESPEESLTYRQLDEAARSRAAALEAAGLRGSTAVLLHPSGLEFVSALLACMYAGVAAAPVQVPTRPRGLERLRRVADDAGTTTVLTTAAVKLDLETRFGDAPALAGLTMVDTKSWHAPVAGEWSGPPAGPEDIALLQYTSGSTGDPKGVRVTHANFRGNVAETDQLWPCRPDSAVVNWLPLFHDMGMLFGGVLPLWAGIPAYLMAPEAFIRRPARWLEAISRYGGSHTAAPSFAYELCVRDARDNGVPDGLDLSSLRVAANGAEPVRWDTVRAFTRTFAVAGFRSRAMCPGYGLAENTLKVTGSREDQEPSVLRLSAEALREGRAEPLPPGRPAEDNGQSAEDSGPAQGNGPADEPAAGGRVVHAVGSGRTVGRTSVRITDPVTLSGVRDRTVGEIWVNGPCVADGYHRRPEESSRTFGARLAGEEDRGTWLRTGDLGFVHEGELFVTGRLKDVIIRKGRNHYPQDIEVSAERADPALRPNCAAAFSLDDGTAERLVLVVEADGRALRNGGADGLRERVRSAVLEDRRLKADEVLVVRRGSLPKTSSGKVQRRATRQQYLEGGFGTVAAPSSPDAR
ncbi:fatty acyl-AMP ligase [Streptomyces sp. NBC_01201]|uniref:fatty acyl-AMP ligase n=1 Tax=unclassified Streptomyces TaxID=2593676 RepID=UPI0011CC16FF|nr:MULTISPECIES: fatty acyl-AMP ligase [unclassified Streptomyces]TXS06863.1 fatty acyl-AMP ligase [Streptomyces sp. wa22]WSR52860.1 fatty acyl-AMP ligase [Streptomyces sp. NBC_01201]